MTRLYNVLLLSTCPILLLIPIYSAYQVILNGKPMDVELVDTTSGGMFQDRKRWTDDYGNPLPTIENAACSSLVNEECTTFTKKPVISGVTYLPNYFPSRALELTYSADYNPYHLKQTVMDYRLEKLFSNAYYVNTHKSYFNNNFHFNPNRNGNINYKNRHNSWQHSSISSTSTSYQTSSSPSSISFDNKDVDNSNFKHMSTKKYSFHKKDGKVFLADSSTKNINNDDENSENSADEDANEGEDEGEQNNETSDSETVDIEVELFGEDINTQELMNALGVVDQEELSDTIDQLVAKLISSYIENDEDVDVAQVYIQGLYGDDNGDVNIEGLNLDDSDVEEMNVLLSSIKTKYKDKHEAGEHAHENDEDDEIQEDENDQLEI